MNLRSFTKFLLLIFYIFNANTGVCSNDTITSETKKDIKDIINYELYYPPLPGKFDRFGEKEFYLKIKVLNDSGFSPNFKFFEVNLYRIPGVKSIFYQEFCSSESFSKSPTENQIDSCLRSKGVKSAKDLVIKSDSNNILSSQKKIFPAKCNFIIAKFSGQPLSYYYRLKGFQYTDVELLKDHLIYWCSKYLKKCEKEKHFRKINIFNTNKSRFLEHLSETLRVEKLNLECLFSCEEGECNHDNCGCDEFCLKDLYESRP